MANTINEEVICEKIINTFPKYVRESIEDNNGSPDVEYLVKMVAPKICEWPKRAQQHHFNTYFGTINECERWMLKNLNSLYEKCLDYAEKYLVDLDD